MYFTNKIDIYRSFLPGVGHTFIYKLERYYARKNCYNSAALNGALILYLDSTLRAAGFYGVGSHKQWDSRTIAKFRLIWYMTQMRWGTKSEWWGWLKVCRNPVIKPPPPKKPALPQPFRKGREEEGHKPLQNSQVWQLSFPIPYMLCTDRTHGPSLNGWITLWFSGGY